MKKAVLPACIVLALALVIALGSQTFLSPCVHEDGSFGACHWAGRALLGIGCVTAILAALALALRHAKARLGVYLSLLPVTLLGILTPGTLIDLCRMSTMRCRAAMQPAMIILFAVMLVCAGVGALLSAKE